MARRGGKLRLMFRVLVWAVGILGVLLAVGAGTLALIGMPTYSVPTISLEVDSTPKRVAAGKRLTSLLCVRCHFDSTRGRLRGRNLIEIPKRLGNVVAPNITRDPDAGIGSWSSGELALLLRTGLHPKTGTAVPPPVMPRWPRMSDDDLMAIVAFLESDDPWVEADSEPMPASSYSLVGKFKALRGWEPLPYPREPIEAVDPADPDARGTYLVDHLLQCATCHSDQWGVIDQVDPRRTPGYLAGGAASGDINGVAVWAANLTPHATGLADRTSAQLHQALVGGFGADGKVLRWPMMRYPGLSRSDVEAIHAHLQTVPAVQREVPPNPPYRQVGRKADPGLHLYIQYGCHTCHGQNGTGVGDLRRASEHYPTDAELVAFLRDPWAEHPYTPMPAWDGVIAEADYPELVQFIRQLSPLPKDEP